MRLSPALSLVLFVAMPAWASHNPQLQVKVLAIRSQNVSGVGIGPVNGGMPHGGDFANTVPCGQPYPSDTAAVIPGDNPGSADHCVLAGPSGEMTGTVQNQRVQAILTTQDGQTFYAGLGCQKQYGWCAPLATHTTYTAGLNDQPKWLADYQHRPALGFMKLTFHPDGKKKVTYLIEYAVKVKLIKQ